MPIGLRQAKTSVTISEEKVKMHHSLVISARRLLSMPPLRSSLGDEENNNKQKKVQNVVFQESQLDSGFFVFVFSLFGCF